MTGTIKRFYAGTGWIMGDDGEEYFVHYTGLVQKERKYKAQIGRASCRERV